MGHVIEIEPEKAVQKTNAYLRLSDMQVFAVPGHISLVKEGLIALTPEQHEAITSGVDPKDLISGSPRLAAAVDFEQAKSRLDTPPVEAETSEKEPEQPETLQQLAAVPDTVEELREFAATHSLSYDKRTLNPTKLRAQLMKSAASLEE